jgi:hypothetical protein
MQATFTLAPADLTRMLKMLRPRLLRLAGRKALSIIINITAWTGLGLAASAWWALFNRYPRLAPELTILAGGLLGGLAILLLLNLYQRYLVNRILVAPSGSFLREQTVRIDEQGVRLVTEYSERFYQWPAFLGIEEDAVNFYLLIDNAECVILPKFAFGTLHVTQLKAWVLVEPKAFRSQ